MKKHKWITNNDEYKDGSKEPYAFGAQNLGSEYHNGPKCKVCGYEFCEHCNPDGFKTECGKVSSEHGDESKIVFRF